jgi:ribosomal protein S18 acetylase RimI-like enzyme
MTITINLAKLEDAARIAELHIQAFSPNALMQAIHGPPSTWQALQKSAEEKFRADMQNANMSVLVAREDDEEMEVVGYAVWVHPEEERARAPLPSWNLPESTNWDVLRPWKEEAGKVAEGVIRDTVHYGEFSNPTSRPLVWVVSWQYYAEELAWLVVDPEYARRGIGTLLLRWGLDRCEKERVPTYVESTVEAAKTFYAKAGFVEKGRIRLDLGGEGNSGKKDLYEEVACTYEPAGDTESCN